MCSPVEGPRKTETSHVLIKSLELKCHVHFFDYLYIYIYRYFIFFFSFFFITNEYFLYFY